MPQANPATTLLKILFWFSAALFILSLNTQTSIVTVGLKTTPILCLIILVLQTSGDWRKYAVICALLFSGSGDLSLELGYFTPGLGCFLIAHLFYISVFSQQLELSRIRIGLTALALASTLCLAIFLTPYLGESRLAVYCYMLVISCMAVAACLGSNNHPAIIIGAFIFIASDALIAIDRFYTPIEGVRYAIMSTYYLAQFFLTTDARKGRYSK